MPTATAVAAAPSHVTSAATTAPALDHLSWSSVSSYTQCPKKFEFKYLLQAVPDFAPSALVFGQALHRAVEFLQATRLEGAAIPEVTALLQEFREGWKSNTGPIQFSKTDDEAALFALAERMLIAYRQHVIDTADVSTVVGIEHAERFKLHPDLPDIEARIDLVELSGTDLIVTDFKSSRGRWNDEKAREYLPQLVLYAYAARPLLKELGATRIVPRFIVISKLKTVTIQTLEPKATQADADRLKDQVLEVYRAIQAGVFVPRTGWHCAQCPFKSQCPAIS